MDDCPGPHIVQIQQKVQGVGGQEASGHIVGSSLASCDARHCALFFDIYRLRSPWRPATVDPQYGLGAVEGSEERESDFVRCRSSIFR
jgi:hypothetical protein